MPVVLVIGREDLYRVTVREPENGEALLLDVGRELEDVFQERHHLPMPCGAATYPSEAGDIQCANYHHAMREPV